MSLNWSLEELYSSFESNEFKGDLQKTNTLIEDYNSWVNNTSTSYDNVIDKLHEYINKTSSLKNFFFKLGSFIELSLSVNTKNTEALKASDILNQNVSNMAESDAKIEKWIGEISNIDELLEKSPFLKEYEFFLKEKVELNKYILSEKEEKVIAKMQNTGSNAWLKLKDSLISNHKVELNIKGEKKEVPLTVVLNMAHDKDKEVRKAAYEAEIESYKKIEDGVAAALNAIKGEVLTISDLRGYKSPLEMSLINSRMDEESLNAMLEAMKESLPIFRKYLRKKAELLGYKNGLPFYELYAPISDADMEFSYEKGKKFVEDNFRTFSDNLADFAKMVFDKNWIDVMPKEGKVGGAFCENLHFLGESRFLLNYGNSFNDVVTMAHELGHGFHGECLKGEAVLNADYPMPIAETASTFCETIVMKAGIKAGSKEEALSILETEISGCTQVIVDIYSRFLFESELFERRKNGALSAEEIKEIMVNAQREAYGDGLDPEYLHPYMWTWKPHYYYANSNFYNFPYAFGLLFSKGLYAEYLKSGKDFPKVYEELLSITGKNKLADVTKVMNIDIRNIDFWRASLKTIEEDIEEFIKLS
ncbi:M3 family oligoendopeptidase [Clostridium intestinale]|uniref:M3 family oligoendopeptidase n=1 Tax=Clostridium intestinale TaxID=36845 RepID=UPI002DD6A6B7|nr:M3 family oligoendopeptidase [Clostridium intestinale]WRY50105.1 M3 family oligoendopeptidase [Clostridium intestinale]